MKENAFYTIEEGAYQTLLGNHTEMDFITIKYMLPFHLPVEDYECLIFEKTTFMPVSKEYDPPTLEDGFGRLPLKHTIVEATVRLSPRQKKTLEKEFEEGRKDIRESSSVFDRQLELLNQFIEFVMARIQLLNIYRVHMGELIGNPLFKIYTYDKGTIKHSSAEGMLMVRDINKVEGDDYYSLSNDEMKNIMGDFYQHIENPYKDIAVVSRKGERAFELHDYDNAIVHYNTVFEVILVTFVWNYYTLLNLKTQSEVDNVMDAGLKNIIRHHFYEAMKALDLPDHEVIKEVTELYLKNGYLYRNAIVHQGVSVGEEEAKHTLTTIKDLTYLLTHNMHEIKDDDEPNAFVDEYTTYNAVTQPGMYDTIKKKYSGTEK